MLAAASLSKVFPQIGNAFTTQHPGVSFSFSFGGTDQLVAPDRAGRPRRRVRRSQQEVRGPAGRRGDGRAVAGLLHQPAGADRARLEPRRDPCPGGPGPSGHQAGGRRRERARRVLHEDGLANLDASLGSDYSTKALANVVSNEDSVAGVLTKVQTGEADAGFVYMTDASGAGDQVLQSRFRRMPRRWPPIRSPWSRRARTPRRPGSSSTSWSGRRASRSFGQPGSSRPPCPDGTDRRMTGRDRRARRPRRAGHLGPAGLRRPSRAGHLPAGAARDPGGSAHSKVTLQALAVSLKTSLIALALIVAVGTPVAYVLGTRSFPGRTAGPDASSSCRSSCPPPWRGSGCSPRSAGSACSAGSCGPGDPDSLHAGRGGHGAGLRGHALLRPAGAWPRSPAWTRSCWRPPEPWAPGRAGRSCGSPCPWLGLRAVGGGGAGVGARARGVRGHDRVRRQPPGPDPDASAGVYEQFSPAT